MVPNDQPAGQVGGDSGPSVAGRGPSNRDWWPNQLNLGMLHQNPPAGNPMGEGFDYAEEFNKLDLAAVKQDLRALMTSSPGVVAGRLWQLRRAHDPHGVA